MHVVVVSVCIRCVVVNVVRFIWVEFVVVKLSLVWSAHMDPLKLRLNMI